MNRNFTMRKNELQAACAWARGLCLITLGPVQGEAYFRTISAVAVLEAWHTCTRKQRVAEA